MTTTLAQIARVAGVSIATVSRALTDSNHPMKDETRRRIVCLAEEMGYKPNLIARSLQSSRTYSVGVIVDRIDSPFAAATVQGIQDGLRQGGYSISIVNSNRDTEAVAGAIKIFYSRQVDGIIILNAWLHTFNDAFFSILQGKPYVFVNRLFSQAIQNCVAPGDRYGAQLATKHLADLGHSRIAYINGQQTWIEAQHRLDGYIDVLNRQGLKLDEQLIKQGDWGVESGYQATRDLMRLEQRPTAIFAANDLMALGAIYAIQDTGLRAPHDVAVVGYDDRDFAGWVRPALTTVRMPSYEMGQAAAGLLLNQMNGQGAARDATQVPGELIVRQSCGAKPGYEGLASCQI